MKNITILFILLALTFGVCVEVAIAIVNNGNVFFDVSMDKVLIKVNGQAVTEKEFYAFRKEVPRKYTKKLSETKKKKLYESCGKLIPTVAKRVLLDQKIKEEGITVSPKEIAEYIDSKRRIRSVDEYKHYLEKSNAHETLDADKYIFREVAARKLMDKLYDDKATVVDQKVIENGIKSRNPNVPETIWTEGIVVRPKFPEGMTAEEAEAILKSYKENGLPKKTQELKNDLVEKSKTTNDFYTLAKQCMQNPMYEKYEISKTVNEIHSRSRDAETFRQTVNKYTGNKVVVEEMLGCFSVSRLVKHQPAKVLTKDEIESQVRASMQDTNYRAMIKRYMANHLQYKESIEIVSSNTDFLRGVEVLRKKKKLK